jgi:hypothetical protein
MVVELLPYVRWVNGHVLPPIPHRSVHFTTGRILPYFGCVMKQKSITDCKHTTNETDFDKCFHGTSWAFRDFTADVDEVVEHIRRFHSSRELTSCQYWKNQSKITVGDFAFYNVNCAETSGGLLSPHYFGMRGKPSSWAYF